MSEAETTEVGRQFQVVTLQRCPSYCISPNTYGKKSRGLHKINEEFKERQTFLQVGDLDATHAPCLTLYVLSQVIDLYP